MALKLVSLGRGASGVRLELVRLIEAMLDKGVIPVIPEKGSVGASGDLAPLAHMAAVMMGDGEAFFDGERMPARQALAKAGLTPVVLAAKEGLALINGTQTSTALALAGLFRAHRAAQAALITGAHVDRCRHGLVGALPSRYPHAARPSRARSTRPLPCAPCSTAPTSATAISKATSACRIPIASAASRRSDGACLDLLRSVARTLEIEANAVTDNPLVLSDNSVVSGGNFHAEPVAFAADQIALAVCEIGAISQRRIALLVDPGPLLRPAGLPRQEAGPQLRPDDRRSHVRGADDARTSRCRIRPRSIRRRPRPTRKTMCRWPAMAPAACCR